MALRGATGRDLSPAVTEVAEQPEALITIAALDGAFRFASDPGTPKSASWTHASETGHTHRIPLESQPGWSHVEKSREHAELRLPDQVDFLGFRSLLPRLANLTILRQELRMAQLRVWLEHPAAVIG